MNFSGLFFRKNGLFRITFRKNELFWITFCKKKFSELTVCSYHIMYALQSDSTLYSRLNVKKLLFQNRRDIWSLSDCNGTRTDNHLVHKRTINRLARLPKWLSCVVSTCLFILLRCIWLYWRNGNQQVVYVVVHILNMSVLSRLALYENFLWNPMRK